MKESKFKIYETTSYSQFKTMEGNRAVKDGRVNKIVESINKIGYVLSPILVNEKMEVIDGQGRLSALERDKLRLRRKLCSQGQQELPATAKSMRQIHGTAGDGCRGICNRCELR